MGGQVLGLIMVGFSGHALFPTLRNDMTDKNEYPKMVGVVYFVVTTVYMSISFVGYRMFGEFAQPEVRPSAAALPPPCAPPVPPCLPRDFIPLHLKPFSNARTRPPSWHHPGALGVGLPQGGRGGWGRC